MADHHDAAVVYTVDGHVAHLELNRPEAYNAINVTLAAELERSLRRAGEDTEVRAVLLSGRGKAFCAGGDVKAMAKSGDPAAVVKDLVDASHRVVLTLAALDKPVVAAVHGSTAGAGLGYACAADLVVAGSSARFLSAFTAIGLTPDSGTSWFLPQLVGVHRALEVTLLNRVLTAQEAMAWGLVNSVHADDDVLAAGLALAARLARAAPTATGRTRRLVREASSRRLDAHLELEAASIVSMAGTEDAQRLLAALTTR